jgi:hypothetical protein
MLLSTSGSALKPFISYFLQSCVAGPVGLLKPPIRDTELRCPQRSRIVGRVRREVPAGQVRRWPYRGFRYWSWRRITDKWRSRYRCSSTRRRARIGRSTLAGFAGISSTGQNPDRGEQTQSRRHHEGQIHTMHFLLSLKHNLAPHVSHWTTQSPSTTTKSNFLTDCENQRNLFKRKKSAYSVNLQIKT